MLAPQRKLPSKIEAKFWTFYPIKIRVEEVGKMSKKICEV